MDDTSCKIRVVCRVRPLNEKEKATSEFVVKFPSSSTVELSVSHLQNQCYLLLNINTSELMNY